MTNEEIIKFLQSKQIPQCGDKVYTADEEYEAYQRAIDVVEQTTWIPVSERLPDLKQRVLISYETMDDGKQVDITIYDKHGFLLGNADAWMPLPEPYEPQESEVNNG